jgi:ABC-type tungstate transport system substrate-binding protein
MVEEGSILIVGVVIAGLTEVMTTAIAFETDKGDFEVVPGIIILFLLLLINDAGGQDSPRPSSPGVD